MKYQLLCIGLSSVFTLAVGCPEAARAGPAVFSCNTPAAQMVLKGKGDIQGTYSFDRPVTISVVGISGAKSESGTGHLHAILRINGSKQSISDDNGGHDLTAVTSTIFRTETNTPFTVSLHSESTDSATGDQDTVYFGCTFD